MTLIKNKKRTSSLRITIATTLMIALTIVLAFTPIGMIRLPLISITIAHIPILISTLVLGLYAGVIVSLAFGGISLFIALTMPTSILDPFFVNPLVSILPRFLIPFTTFGTYKLLANFLSGKSWGITWSVALAVTIGNLTNTFGVYTMLYLVYAQEILSLSGKEALSLIIAAISSTTLIKCIFVVIVCVPIIKALNKVIKY